MSNHLTQISSHQRADMITKGLNPINPQHVARYLKGDTRNAVQENQERIAAIMGGKLKANLGHAAERDASFDLSGGRMDYNPSMETSRVTENKPIDYKNQLNQDMENYQNNSEYLGSTPNLLNLRESAPQKQVGNVAEIATRLMTEYYNAFILSLKNPSTKANLEVYKALKRVLEQENNLKAKPTALKLFQESTRSVTSDMYISLKG